MRRIYLVIAVAALAAAMVVPAGPAFAKCSPTDICVEEPL